MSLIIDCYNVLHTEMPASIAGLDEEALCRALAVSRWRGGGITVVCDGVVKPHGPSASPVDEVTLVYSGGGRSADDVIVEMIDRDTSPRKLTVVSTDRQIQKAARRRRAKSWTSERFIHELARSLRAAQGRTSGKRSRPKHSGMSEDEIKRWADAFGLDPDEPVDPEETESWMPIDD